jgi:hypothetical protein
MTTSMNSLLLVPRLSASPTVTHLTLLPRLFHPPAFLPLALLRPVFPPPVVLLPPSFHPLVFPPTPPVFPPPVFPPPVFPPPVFPPPAFPPLMVLLPPSFHLLVFPLTPTMLLLPLILTLRGLGRNPPIPVAASPRRGPTTRGLPSLVASTDETLSTKWSLLLTCAICHVPWCVFINALKFIFQLTRHPFRLPYPARAWFHTFIFHASPTTSHERRAQVAPIHLLSVIPGVSSN